MQPKRKRVIICGPGDFIATFAGAAEKLGARPSVFSTSGGFTMSNLESEMMRADCCIFGVGRVPQVERAIAEIYRRRPKRAKLAVICLSNSLDKIERQIPQPIEYVAVLSNTVRAFPSSSGTIYRAVVFEPMAAVDKIVADFLK